MRVLGIETSCDETGVALYDTEAGLLAHALHSQVAMHAEYGGVVPELASRDHIRRLLPLLRRVQAEAGVGLGDIGAIAYTRGPGLAGALLVGASFASALAAALGVPALGIHHLEGHLLSPLLATPRPAFGSGITPASGHEPSPKLRFPYVALLVSGGHTQLMRVDGVGRYALLGETVDDAAGEAFDKTAQVLGLGYPGGPAVARLAEQGDAYRFKLPRPMLQSHDLDFSFAGLKTAALTLARKEGLPLPPAGGGDPERLRRDRLQAAADIAAGFQEAVVEVLAAKCLAALRQTGLERLVVAGGVGANRRLRDRLDAEARQKRFEVYYPPLELCTDNGAMIAYAGALRLAEARGAGGAFGVRPRWDLGSLGAPA